MYSRQVVYCCMTHDISESDRNLKMCPGARIMLKEHTTTAVVAVVVVDVKLQR